MLTCSECGEPSMSVGATGGKPLCSRCDAHIRGRLEYLRVQIEAECISYAGIAELQGLAEYIEPGDVDLLQWAGVPEFPEDEEV